MSSSGFIGKTTNHPDDVSGAARTDERMNTWGEMPGRVVAFDAEKQTATIAPLGKLVINGAALDLPELQEVPIRFARAGNGAITFPVAAGDRVTLRPQMRSSENYHLDDDGTPSDRRSFNLSDMEAFLDGGESLTDPIQNFDPANVHIRSNPAGTHGMRISEDGKFQFQGAEGDAFDIIAEALELIAADQLQIAYGSSAGTGHALQNRAALIELAAKLRAMAF